MFENKTFETLMSEMLGRVPKNMDKREGSVVWDALAPCAIELANIYIYLDMILDEGFADSATYYFLAKRAAERGILPKAATNAILKAVFEPETLDIPLGSRFNLDELNYSVREKLADGEYSVVCETAGAAGNRKFGKLTPIDYIDGLQSGEIVELLIPGEDDENIEAFRNRYFASFDNEAFGGNIADYKKKVNELQGVGGVKVYPVWNGGGTVKLVIITSEYQVPSDTLIDEVQTIIDPVQNGGEGVGLAPIGHVVTVFGVGAREVNISTNIIYDEGWTFEDVKPYFESVLDEYFEELSVEWDSLSSIIVRISQIETRFLGIQGIVDISDTTINGEAKNLFLGADEIPTRGEIIG